MDSYGNLHVVPSADECCILSAVRQIMCFPERILCGSQSLLDTQWLTIKK